MPSRNAQSDVNGAGKYPATPSFRSASRRSRRISEIQQIEPRFELGHLHDAHLLELFRGAVAEFGVFDAARAVAPNHGAKRLPLRVLVPVRQSLSGTGGSQRGRHANVGPGVVAVLEGETKVGVDIVN